jgi:hypothetical protein
MSGLPEGTMVVPKSMFSAKSITEQLAEKSKKDVHQFLAEMKKPGQTFPAPEPYVAPDKSMWTAPAEENIKRLEALGIKYTGPR